MHGEILTDKYLPFHRRVGEVKTAEGDYTMLVAEPLGTPMVEAPDGRVWAMNWNQLAALAIAELKEAAQ